jgi:hypothetical protein
MNKQRENTTPRSPGRPKGSPNKTTAALKDAIILAAEQTGNDGKGRDGLVGYLKHVAATDVKAFAGLIGRVIPLQIGGDPDNPIQFEAVERDAERFASGIAGLAARVGKGSGTRKFDA